MRTRHVILGIDGVPFDLMNKLSNSGVMPNFNQLKKEFYFNKMKSSIPHISSVSWSSIITGKNPGEHGIFG
ncbi:MAG: alkaline phosphatase family protein, partial [Candidatus Odinarchaeota archaeon]